MLKVSLITRPFEGKSTGLSRYDQTIYEGLGGSDPQNLQVALHPVRRPNSFFFKFVKKLTHQDLAAFWGVHPFWLALPKADLAHITVSSLTTGLWFRSKSPVIVTVHDIIHYVYRRDARFSTYKHSVQKLADALAVRHLRRARMIIASSEFTRQQLIKHAAVSPEKIRVIPLGVDQQVFRPLQVPAEFYERYGLDKATPYVLHLSSEEPRKNVETLLRAWPQVIAQHPNAVLLKVGKSLYQGERQRLVDLVARLNLTASVRFIENVAEADLPLLYNVAQVFAFPSLAEGFGFPVLEAMACGTSVVCSDTPALSEIVGATALQHAPLDEDGLAQALNAVLENPAEQARLRLAGLAQAARFSWQRTTAETYKLYLSLAA